VLNKLVLALNITTRSSGCPRSEVTWLSILLQDVVSSKASRCRLCCVLVIVAAKEQRCRDTGLIRDRSGRSEEACVPCVLSSV
jgi:hypothetical protein